MKLFRIIILLLILAIPAGLVFTNFNKKKLNQPISAKNNSYSKIENFLYEAGIKPAGLKIIGFNNKIEFYIDQTKIILSSEKDPSKQITSLQEVLKIGKIKDKKIKLIDLSIDHPYATLKNN